MGRSPHGERGLKLKPSPPLMTPPPSLPTRGAWIEISICSISATPARSLPTRGAWIEISASVPPHQRAKSLPTRGAWIEMSGATPLPNQGRISLSTRETWVEIRWGCCCIRKEIWEFFVPKQLLFLIIYHPSLPSFLSILSLTPQTTHLSTISQIEFLSETITTC